MCFLQAGFAASRLMNWERGMGRRHGLPRQNKMVSTYIMGRARISGDADLYTGECHLHFVHTGCEGTTDPCADLIWVMRYQVEG